MTELQLYKFVYGDEEYLSDEIQWNGEELTLYINFDLLSDFIKLLCEGWFDDGGHIESEIYTGYVAIDLVPICEYYDIIPENILIKQN
jgi:hypothetical protein